MSKLILYSMYLMSIYIFFNFCDQMSLWHNPNFNTKPTSNITACINDWNSIKSLFELFALSPSSEFITLTYSHQKNHTVRSSPTCRHIIANRQSMSPSSYVPKVDKVLVVLCFVNILVYEKDECSHLLALAGDFDRKFCASLFYMWTWWILWQRTTIKY